MLREYLSIPELAPKLAVTLFNFFCGPFCGELIVDCLC